MIKNFVEDFYQLSDQYGSKEAILFDDENGLSSISYHQLLFLVDQFNTELGDSRKVLSLLPNSVSKILYFLASVSNGKDFCPLACFVTPLEVNNAIKIYKPDVCIVNEALVGQDVIDVLNAQSIKILKVKTFKVPLTQLTVEIGSKGIKKSGCLCLYTSGTTGAPKFLVINLDKLWSSALNFCELYKLNSLDNLRFWNYLPMSYLGGLFNLCLIPLAAGASFFIDEPFSGKTFLNFWNQVNRLRINILWFVPTIIKGLLKLYDQREIQTILHPVSFSFLGTAPIGLSEKKNFEQKFTLELNENYGLSETTFISAEVNKQLEREDGSVGEKSHQVDIKSVPYENSDEEYDELVGQIFVKTPFLFEGYLTAEGLVSPQVDADGYFNTCDLGIIKNDGQLVIKGRTKDIIKKGGQLIFLKEIETLLAESGFANEYIAVSCKHSFYGESYNLFLKLDLKTNREIILTSVQEWIQKNISRNKWPERIIPVDEIPLTSSGKIQKHILRELA